MWVEWLVLGLGIVVLEGLTVAAGVLGCILEGEAAVSATLDVPFIGLLTEYGPAVAGRTISGRRNFVGRTGATDRPPCDTEVEGSGRPREAVDSELAEVVDDIDVPDTVRGEKADIAEPGRAGTLLAAIAAFF